MRAKASSVEIILRKGKPAAVIIDINRYQRMLERLEELDDLKALRDLRARPAKFRKLDDFLAEYSPDA